jgi:hypothetical protein
MHKYIFCCSLSNSVWPTSVCKSVSLSVSLSVSASVCLEVCLFFRLSVCHLSDRQPISMPVSLVVSRPVTRAVSQSVSLPILRLACLSVCHIVCLSFCQSPPNQFQNPAFPKAYNYSIAAVTVMFTFYEVRFYLWVSLLSKTLFNN